MFKNIIYKVTGDPNDKEIKRLQPLVQEINELEPEYEKLSDEELANKTEEFRAEFMEGVDEKRRELDELKSTLANEVEDDYRRQLEYQVKEKEKDSIKH